jgi:hypothetical protein
MAFAFAVLYDGPMSRTGDGAMPEQQPSEPPDRLALRSNLQELAQLLRETPHLEPDAQQELADLVAELSQALAGNLTSAEAQHLGQNAVHMIKALHEQRDQDYLSAARDRLRDAAVRAEVKAPVATGIVRRLIDALTNLGI